MRYSYAKKLLFIAILITAVLGISLAAETVYVVNSYGRHSPAPHWSTVTALNGSDLTFLKDVTVGYDAHDLAITPDGTCIWVSSRGSNNISVLDADKLGTIKIIKGENIATPLSIAFNSDGSKAYITFESIGQIGVFDAKTYSLLYSIPVDGEPSYIVLTPDDKKAYVVDYLNSRVFVILTSNNTLAKTLELRGHKLQDAVMSPDGSMVYVANQDRNQIEVIRTSDDSIIVPIPITDIYPRGIAIHPNGAYIFVGLSSGEDAVVDMLRLSDKTVVSSLKFSGMARSIEVRPDGSRIFVSDYNGDKVYALNVNGENLSLAAVANLNKEPGFRAAPIGLAIREVHATKDLVLERNASGPTSSMKESSPESHRENNRSMPGLGALATAATLVLIALRRKPKGRCNNEYHRFSQTNKNK